MIFSAFFLHQLSGLTKNIAGSTKRNEPCFQTRIMSCLQIQPWEASGLLLEELLFPHIFIH